MLSEIYNKQNFTKKDVHEHLEKYFLVTFNPYIPSITFL